jgi:hypothetical protein
MEQRMKEANISYYDYNDFIDIKEIGGVYKANWKQGGKLIILKSFRFDDDSVKEIVHEVCKVLIYFVCISR